MVALDVDGAALEAGGAQDHAHALRHVELAQHFLHALAVGRVGDLARDAAATPGIGHQHAVAAGQRQVGGEGGTLVAALFLDDLHQQDLPALDDLLDLVLADRIAAAALARLALLDHVVAAQRLHGHFGLRRVGRVGRRFAAGVSRRLDRSLGGGFGIDGCRLLGGWRQVGCLGGRGDRRRLGAFGRLRRTLDAFAGDGGGLGLRLGLGDDRGRQGLGRGLVGDRPVAGILGIGDGLGGHFRRRLAAGRVDRALGAIVLAHFLDVGAVDPVAAARLVVVGFGVQALLLGDQPFAVGDGDLIVVGMDFREGQEAVAVAAILDERRLQRRLDADDLGEIDVALEGLAARRLEIEFFQSCSINDDHPGLFGVARIDEHAPCHGSLRGVLVQPARATGG